MKTICKLCNKPSLRHESKRSIFYFHEYTINNGILQSYHSDYCYIYKATNLGYIARISGGDGNPIKMEVN